MNNQISIVQLLAIIGLSISIGAMVATTIVHPIAIKSGQQSVINALISEEIEIIAKAVTEQTPVFDKLAEENPETYLKLIAPITMNIENGIEK